MLEQTSLSVKIVFITCPGFWKVAQSSHPLLQLKTAKVKPASGSCLSHVQPKEGVKWFTPCWCHGYALSGCTLTGYSKAGMWFTHQGHIRADFSLNQHKIVELFCFLFPSWSDCWVVCCWEHVPSVIALFFWDWWQSPPQGWSTLLYVWSSVNVPTAASA